MLYVHPSSTCDVCLEGYNCSTVETTPHAIACGHVFCQECLRSLSPAVCPLCRKAFRADRIKKLHVSGYAPEGTDPVVEAQENILIQRVALLFGEGTPLEHVDELEQEVQRWLSGRAAHDNAHKSLRCAVSALRRYKTMQQEEAERVAGVREMHETFERSLAMKDQDVETARIVEANLAAEMQSMHAREKEMEAQLSERESRLAELNHQLHELSKHLSNSEKRSGSLPQAMRSASLNRVTSSSSVHTNGHHHRPLAYLDDQVDDEESDDSDDGPPPSARHISSARIIEDFIPPPLPPPKEDVWEWSRQGQEALRRSAAPAANPAAERDLREAGQRGNYVSYSVSKSAGPSSEPMVAPRMGRSRSNTITATEIARACAPTEPIVQESPPQTRSRANSTRGAQAPVANGFLPPLVEVPSSQASSNTNSISSASLRSMSILQPPDSGRPRIPHMRSDSGTAPRQPDAPNLSQDIPSPESWGTVTSSAHSSMDLSLAALPGRLPSFSREANSTARPQEHPQAPAGLAREPTPTANVVSSWNFRPPRLEPPPPPEPARAATAAAPDPPPAEAQGSRFQDRFAVHREPSAQSASRPQVRRTRGRPLPTYDPYNVHMFHPDDRDPNEPPPAHPAAAMMSTWNDHSTQGTTMYDTNAGGWGSHSAWPHAPAQVEPEPPVHGPRSNPRTPRGHRSSESAKSMDRVASDPGHTDAGLGLTLSSSSGSHRGVVNSHDDLNVVSRSLMQYADRSSEDTPHPHGRRSRRPSVVSAQPGGSFSRGEQDAAYDSHVGTRTGLQLYATLPPQSGPTPYPGEARSGALARTLSGGGTLRNRDRDHDHDGNTTDSEVAYTNHSNDSRRSGRRSSASTAAMSRPITSASHAQSSTATRPRPYEVPLPPISAASSRTTYSQSLAYIGPSMTPAYAPTAVQGSLGLNFAPIYPTSAAVTQTGEESAIRAPKPITSSRGGGILGNIWSSRPGR